MIAAESCYRLATDARTGIMPSKEWHRAIIRMAERRICTLPTMAGEAGLRRNFNYYETLPWKPGESNSFIGTAIMTDIYTLGRSSTLRDLGSVLVIAALASSCSAVSVETQTSQAQLAHQLVTGDAGERAAVLAVVRQFEPDEIGNDLRAALITALEQEGARNAARRRGELADLEHPELIAGLAHVVSGLGEEKAIPGLAGALGTSPPAIFALAEFRENAVEYVIDAISVEGYLEAVTDGLISLRLMVEQKDMPPLSSEATGRIVEVAKAHLTGEQSPVTLWRAIDLAVALNDTLLTSIVRKLATDDREIRARGIAAPQMISRTKQIASERLAGVPAKPSYRVPRLP